MHALCLSPLVSVCGAYPCWQVMVFFSSCASVKFHSELLNFIDMPVMDIHGKQKQQKRTTTYFEFCHAKSGTLLCTDVAARGLDIPAVDWIIQYDPPDDPKVRPCATLTLTLFLNHALASLKLLLAHSLPHSHLL